MTLRFLLRDLNRRSGNGYNDVRPVGNELVGSTGPYEKLPQNGGTAFPRVPAASQHN